MWGVRAFGRSRSAAFRASVSPVPWSTTM
jgi:hypothetical protein